MGKFRAIRYGVIGLMGLIVCLASHPAIAALSTSTSPLPTEQAVAQAAPGLEQQAQAAYEQGQYQQAIDLLQQAQRGYQAQGETTRTAIALSNLSLTHQQLGNWAAAAASIDQAENLLAESSITAGVQAQVMDVRGQLEFARGDLDAALNTWEDTANLYDQLNNPDRQALSRLNQAQALQAQGLFQQVLRTLDTLATELASQPDSEMKAITLRHLGDSLRAMGYLEEADQALQDSLVIARQLQNEQLIAATTLSLGNLEQGKFKAAIERQNRREALGYAQKSLSFYQQVAALSEETLGVQARLNLMQLFTNPEVAQWDTAAAFYPQVKQRLPQLSAGREAIYGYTGLAENLIVLKNNSDRADPSWGEIADLLATAHTQAVTLGDRRAASLVLGTLGHVYEQNRQWEAAADLSRQALALAQPIRADDISYRWQWQLGRILKRQQQEDKAIAAYSGAFATLQSIRSDLITANSDVQFSFRESVEPVYRELADLLLTSVPALDSPAQLKVSSKQAQARLRQARDVMEALQVAELENFFQSACIEKTVNIDQVVDQQEGAAVLYAILLPDRIEVIVKLPEQEDLVHYSTPVEQATVEQNLKAFRATIVRGNEGRRYGQQLYDWLLRPAVESGLITSAVEAQAAAPKSALPDNAIETLLFVLDGDLRLIPMGNLHDGEKYLIEKYSLSLILGLEVRDPQQLPPRPELQVLAASLTDPPPSEADSYASLPGVGIEMEKIAATELPATFLRDDAFTQTALENQLNQTDYTIVHLATHGQFGSDRRNTFILTADGRFDIDALGRVFQSRRQADTRLEMLIFSACKTATGSSREVLGIAGAAVQAGARSTIATLWSVDDAASVLFAETLYDNLGEPGVSRAEALRRAQVALMQRYPGRPRFWSPYVLVGSWR
ncbi:MAG: CHAT domain-containing protein [Cyanobacteria bacterium J06638_28]